MASFSLEGVQDLDAYRPRGYGLVKGEDGVMLRVHRVMYLYRKGEIPDGHVIRHTCDRPICCNPDHLITGTTAENSADMIERGRQAKGESCANSKLKNEDIEIIIMLSQDGIRAKEIAAKFNVDESTVHRIKSGKAWKHITHKYT